MKLPIYTVPKWEEESLPILNNILTKVLHAINNVEFGNGILNENVWCAFVTTPGDNGANEACSASHTLNRKPIGTVTIWQDKAAVLYKPTAATSADTTDQVFYKFDTASTSAILLLL